MFLATLITAAVTAVSAVVAPAAAAAPDIDHHQSQDSIRDLTSVTGPAPGREFRNVDKELTCTFGFKATRGGDTGYLTAGHCGDVGDTITIKTPTGTREVGEVTWSLGSPQNGAEYDLAFISIRPTVVTSAVVERASRSPQGTMTRENMILANPDLCKVGPKSGDTCGTVTPADISHRTVSFDAESIHGDSGSPVFAQTRAGEVVAIGILSGSPTGQPNTIVAYLIDDDTLTRYGLSVSRD